MSEHDPFLTEEEREENRALAAIAEHNAAIEGLKDICWLASGPRGRRILRGLLREAGVNIMAASVGSTFATNYGQMCFAEGARARGLNLLAQLTKALVTGDLKLEHWQLLNTEKD